MKEILFRGKRIEDVEWVEGDLMKNEQGHFIVEEFESCNLYGDDGDSLFGIMWHQVDPETVGQYTGLKDKNGKKIFEGDKVKGKDNYNYCLPFNGTVGFKDGSFVIIGDIIIHYRWMDYSVEIIGNIHEGVEK